MAGYRWVNHEWLTETILASFRINNLWFLVEIFFAIVVSIPFFYWIHKIKKWEEWLLVFLSFVFFNYVAVRPQVISFTLFWLFLQFLIFRFSDKWKKQYFVPYIVLSALFFLFWANLHGAFFSAITAWGIFIAVEAFENWRREGIFFYRYCWFDFGAIFGSVALTLINPFGWRIYEEIFSAFTNKIVANNIIEWLPFPNLAIFHPEYIIFVCLFITLSLFGWRKLSLNQLAVAIFFLTSFILHIRMGPFFILSATYLMIYSLKEFREQIEEIPKNFLPKIWTRIGISIPIILMVGVFSYSFLNYFRPSASYNFLGASDYLNNLEKDNKAIRLFNDYGWGGYLIDNVREVRVYIDGRGPHWRDDNGYSVMEEYLSVFDKKKSQWRNVFAKYNINTVIIPTTKSIENRQESLIAKWKVRLSFLPERLINYVENKFKDRKEFDLYSVLSKNKDWKIAYEDKSVAIFIKKENY